MNNQTILVASTLHQAGFSVDMVDNSILAWLNRPMSKQEVETILDREFEEVEFNVEYSPGKNLVMITL